VRPHAKVRRSCPLSSFGARPARLDPFVFGASPASVVDFNPVSAPSLSGRVVLVIEDHDDTRATLVQLLASLGAQVHEAPDGLAGLTELARWRPDVVFCDLAMPIMDGLEFAKAVRALPSVKHLPIILISGAQAHIGMQRSDLFNVVLEKPFNIDLIIDEVKKLLADRH